MGTPTTVMNVARHRGIPAPSTDKILAADPVLAPPTCDGRALRLTTLGVAYLPVPWDLQTWVGLGLAGVVGALGFEVGVHFGMEEIGKAFADPVIRDRVVPDRVRASLRRKGSFVAGYANIISVDTWFSGRGIKVGVANAGGTTAYTVGFADVVRTTRSAS